MKCEIEKKIKAQIAINAMKIEITLWSVDESATVDNNQTFKVDTLTKFNIILLKLIYFLTSPSHYYSHVARVILRRNDELVGPFLIKPRSQNRFVIFFQWFFTLVNDLGYFKIFNFESISVVMALKTIRSLKKTHTNDCGGISSYTFPE